MRSEPWLILQTGTKTIPIIFQNHRFVIDPQHKLLHAILLHTLHICQQTGNVHSAWEPLASLQTHYVRVTSVASFMWPDCKQPVGSISSSSNTTAAALLKIFFDDASPQRPDAQHFFSQLLIVGSCTTNFITAISSDLTYLNKFQEFLEILRPITAWRRL